MVAACREFLQIAHNFHILSGVRTPGFYTPRSEMTRITTFDDLVPKSGVSGRGQKPPVVVAHFLIQRRQQAAYT